MCFAVPVSDHYCLLCMVYIAVYQYLVSRYAMSKSAIGLAPQAVTKPARWNTFTCCISPWFLAPAQPQVKRSAPLPSLKEVSKAVDARSLYAAPFPMNASLDGITAAFEAVAPVNCVRLRRHVVSRGRRLASCKCSSWRVELKLGLATSICQKMSPRKLAEFCGLSNISELVMGMGNG